MHWVVRLLNVIVAICVMALVLLIFWFLFAMYFRGSSAGGTVAYMTRTIEGWSGSIAAWFASLAP